MKKIIDLRVIISADKYRAAVTGFDSIKKGEKLQLINDNDLRSMFYQLSSEMNGRFYWQYVESGPDIWKINIKKL